MWSVFRSLFGKKLEDGRKILPAGDCALVVEFGNEINEALNRKVQCLNEKVAAGPCERNRGDGSYLPFADGDL